MALELSSPGLDRARWTTTSDAALLEMVQLGLGRREWTCRSGRREAVDAIIDHGREIDTTSRFGGYALVGRSALWRLSRRRALVRFG